MEELELQGESTGEGRRDQGIGRASFNGTQKPQAMKEKHQIAFRQMKKFCFSKDSHTNEKAGHKLGNASCEAFTHKRTHV